MKLWIWTIAEALLSLAVGAAIGVALIVLLAP